MSLISITHFALCPPSSTTSPRPVGRPSPWKGEGTGVRIERRGEGGEDRKDEWPGVRIERRGAGFEIKK